MNRNNRIALLLAVAVLLIGCSREGFADSLSRENETSSSQVESKPERVGAVYKIEELTVEGVEGTYPSPIADSEEQEKAAKRIGRSIRSTVGLMPEYLAAADGNAVSIALSCEVTANSGEYVSVWFSLTQKSGENEKRHGWGMILDAATGADVGAERLIDPQALSILLLDGPSVEILDADEATAQKQRDYLNQLGSEALCERLLASDSSNPEALLNASCYLSGSQLVAVFAAPQELGGVVRAAIRI